jgi:hypothetical protein
MSTFKPFTTSDVLVSPFKVNKTFSFFGISELTGSNVEIDRFYGTNITSSLWVSGSYPTGQINIQDEILVYRSIKELYYSNFISGSNGSPANTASFNNDGTITGLPYQPSYYNYLSTTLTASRYFPTGSGEQIGVISIPSNLYGEYIQPGSITVNVPTLLSAFSDDSNGNLIDSSTNLKVGDVIYEHGLVIFTGPNSPLSPTYLSNIIDPLVNIGVEFTSTITIYETQYKCTLRENEFNFTQNPTAVSGSMNSGILYDFATGSYFSPYVTTVGLYNNNYELIAVGKLAQPLPTSAVTDTTILVNLDMLS